MQIDEKNILERRKKIFKFLSFMDLGNRKKVSGSENMFVLKQSSI